MSEIQGTYEKKMLDIDQIVVMLFTSNLSLCYSNYPQVHAARTGHQSFSESAEEIKALTEEEKREQVVRSVITQMF